jgi:transposase
MGESMLSRCIGYLKTVPGIRWIVASQLMARIRDWRQIQNIRQLPAFLGLMPKENSTGERTDRGSITHSGDPRLRSKLIQVSWSGIRQDAELREFFRSVCKNYERPAAAQVAAVPVAHKLSVRASVVLMRQRPYEMREKVQSAPLNQEETVLQGTTRRELVPGE